MSTPESPREHTPDPSLQPRKTGKRVTEKTASEVNVTYSWCAASETKSRTGFIRYYNPVDGRWINRDPIGERGGLNRYTFTLNAPCNFVDMFGLATRSGNKDGSQTITVNKCEVAVVIGHGIADAPHTFVPPKDGGGCWAGGVVCCGSKSTNERIPQENQIPGSPMFDDTVTNKDQAWDDAYWAIIAGAKEKAKEICKEGKCKCKTVKISYTYAPFGDFLIDLVNGVPKGEEIQCNQSGDSK